MYPVTIIADRYTGAYSNGVYTAWNCFPNEIPNEVEGDDVTCMEFWSNFKQGEISLDDLFTPKLFCGKGKTPNDALNELKILKK